jgi:hypothetical protein
MAEEERVEMTRAELDALIASSRAQATAEQSATQMSDGPNQEWDVIEEMSEAQRQEQRQDDVGRLAAMSAAAAVLGSAKVSISLSDFAKAINLPSENPKGQAQRIAAQTAAERDARAGDRRTFTNFWSGSPGEDLEIQLPPDVTSLTDMGNSVVRFGKVYVGKTYRDTLEEGGLKYAKWLYTRVTGEAADRLKDDAGKFKDFLLYCSCALSLGPYELRVGGAGDMFRERIGDKPEEAASSSRGGGGAASAAGRSRGAGEKDGKAYPTKEQDNSS